MAAYLYRVLLLFSPISSWLVISAIQGFTPAVAVAVGILILLLVDSAIKKAMPKALFMAAPSISFIVFLIAISQLLISIFGVPDTGSLILIRPSESFQPLRSTIFSQGVYLLFCVLFFFLTLTLYKKKYDAFLIASGTFFAIYGLYELAYYFFLGENGDFISNRVFGDGAEGSGSLFQAYNIAGITMQRLKSLSGEPSMYTFTVFPIFIFAIGNKKYVQAAVIAFSLLMTMSSTAMLVFLVYVISLSLIYKSVKPLIFSTLVVSAIALSFYPIVEALIKETLAKLALESFSGEDRIGSFFTHLDYWLEAPLHIKLFGIGFGSVRSLDFFSTLLVNSGFIGFLLVTAIFFYPVVALPLDRRNNSLRCSLICIYFMLMTSVSEYSYAMPWIFLGISYAEIGAKTALIRRQFLFHNSMTYST